MASVTKTAKGYRAQVYVKGVRDSDSFRTKREADAWAAARETELREQISKPLGEKYTFADALIKYRNENTIKKRGKRWEEIRINAFLASPILPTSLPIGEVTPAVLGQWRNKRLQEVSAGTVLRDFNVLSPMFEIARKEWGWVKVNPCVDVDRPAAPPHRNVLISRRSIRIMLETMGYKRGPVKSVTHSLACMFLLALRTGMRGNELCCLTWGRVHDGYCSLPETKTVSRDVPLSAKAMRILEQMRGFDDKLVFGMNSNTRDALFRKYRARAGLKGFTFHDSRHTAATWMARKLHILDLCKMFGWKDTRHALIYYNPKASDIAKRL